MPPFYQHIRPLQRKKSPSFPCRLPKFKIIHYTLSFDGKQLLVETYRLAAPSASVNISHTTEVLRSEIPYQFREGRELLRFRMDEEGMKILRFERYTINPATGEATLSLTHYPVEQPQ